MDTNKNLYTILYSTVMVVVVAVVLALASYLLKDKQQRNIEIETKLMILKSVHLGEGANKAEDKATYIEKEYSKYIKDTTIKEGDNILPLYICTLENNDKFYIAKLHGPGLWGPIWGYLSLKSDFNTIYGAIFDHKGETPGLGAEISTSAFYNQFNDKKIFEGNEFVSIKVVKGGAAKGSTHEIDAISGGTITSKAVEALLKSSISEYLHFFQTNLNQKPESEELTDSATVTPIDSIQLAKEKYYRYLKSPYYKRDSINKANMKKQLDSNASKVKDSIKK